MAKENFYVVWKGIQPGVYTSWKECRQQIEDIEGALYKSFDSKESAQNAYHSGPWEYIGKSRRTSKSSILSNKNIIKNSLAVDAACSGNPGPMEYRGVFVATGQVIFRIGPYRQGTNNIGEFLAIVHGLALLKKQQSDIPIYTDSVNAMLWIKNKKCKTKLIVSEENKPLFELISRAEKWLQENTYANKIIKWETENWGEIPADFGRK